ncbi:unnamed protein product (macronuclear) [Paramecium tetraurelia]|uniref:HTH psq-type domain-containing protein n=1 Tax=Paramecium tetraurelia TaxID=5888 RepID=A0D594_PARTE|nr:uncharacterized protein GSPATT00013658001 [Paramecium tetraurelia]CAK78211.1 unnamed protein product [Paramecium tetraurelia]|eukprot:XP_001445608.1 hypothetical protein (macronuclear) [Paramecium tetraurelia strain d4-2]
MPAQKRDYKIVQKSQREALIFLVFKQGQKIKEASNNLEIKYAVAKTIVIAYRKRVILEKRQILSTKSCKFKLRENQKSVHQIITKIGGECVNDTQKMI